MLLCDGKPELGPKERLNQTGVAPKLLLKKVIRGHYIRKRPLTAT